MKSEVITVRVQTLVLSDAEANWLKGTMQNPLWVDHPDKEEPFDKTMRESFFNAVEWAPHEL